MINKNISIAFLTLPLLLTLTSCSKEDDKEVQSYDNWTIVGSGLSESVSKNVLTEFVGSTNCPYCPEQDALLLSYFDSGDDNFVGSSITDNWFLINYHTYHPSSGDPMYLFLRGDDPESDYCYIRFGNGYGTGSWYNIGGVPTTYTNGSYTNVNAEMAVGPMAENTPIQLSLAGTNIDGSDVTVQVSINSSRDMSSSDSLHLFIAATLDNVDYTGYNLEAHHQDVFLGWINDGLEGELLSLGNEKIARTYSWIMPENWPQNNYSSTWSEVDWDVSGLAVVAFIQNKYTKEVVQVAGAN